MSRVDESAGVRHRPPRFAGDRLEALSVDRRGDRSPDARTGRSNFSGARRSSRRCGGSCLAARAPGEAAAAGPLVCSCFGVRSRTIAAAIDAGDDTLEAVGRIDARRDQLRLVQGGDRPASRRAQPGDERAMSGRRSIARPMALPRSAETTPPAPGGQTSDPTLEVWHVRQDARQFRRGRRRKGGLFPRIQPPAFFVSSMMAGAYVGIGIILIFSLGQQIEPALRSLTMGACFGIALTLVVFAGSDLFTGHTMFMTHRRRCAARVDLAALAARLGLELGRQSRSAPRCWRWSSGCGGGGQILKEGADLIYAASAAKMNAPAAGAGRPRRPVQLAGLPRAVDERARFERRRQMHSDLVVPVRLHRQPASSIRSPT